MIFLWFQFLLKKKKRISRGEMDLSRGTINSFLHKKINSFKKWNGPTMQWNALHKHTLLRKEVTLSNTIYLNTDAYDFIHHSSNHFTIRSASKKNVRQQVREIYCCVLN